MNTLDDVKYFTALHDRLSPRERIVVLMVDEFYLLTQVAYKSGTVHGYAETSGGVRKSEIAKTAQGLMIASAFSKMSELYKMLPVAKQTGSELKIVIDEAIHFLQSVGFTVLTVIYDGCKLNQSLGKLLTTGRDDSLHHWFINPTKPDKKIFVMFDSVHLWKNIRNNWLSLQYYRSDTDLDYIAAACSSKILKRWCKGCVNCKFRNILADSKGGLNGDEFHDFQQRGGLLIASELSRFIVRVGTAILIEVTSKDDLRNYFLSFGIRQKDVLASLTFDVLIDSNVEMDDACEHCGKDSHEILWKFLSPMSNILLNAFARKENCVYQRAMEEKRIETVVKKKKLVAQRLHLFDHEAEPMEIDEVCTSQSQSQTQSNFNPMPHRKVQIFNASH